MRTITLCHDSKVRRAALVRSAKRLCLDVIPCRYWVARGRGVTLYIAKGYWEGTFDTRAGALQWSARRVQQGAGTTARIEVD